VSVAVSSSPEKEVADQDNNVKVKKKKGRPPIEHHRPKDTGESASASARTAGDKLRTNVDLISLSPFLHDHIPPFKILHRLNEKRY
jgi:hypothetical protein